MRVLALTILCAHLFAQEFVNFERGSLSDFVIETKHIVLADFPDAYNPSLLEWGDGYLLSFRTGDQARCSANYVLPSFIRGCKEQDPEDKTCLEKARQVRRLFNCKNQIGLVQLDKDLNLAGPPAVLYINYPRPLVPERQHDPRLVRVADKVFVVYSNMITGWRKPEIRRPFVTELLYEEDVFFSASPKPIVRYEGEDPKSWAKNWVPFACNNTLLMSHYINPHIVFQYDGTIACATVSKSEAHIEWPYGELRGGTPAVLDDDGQYIAIFHSSVAMKSEHSKGIAMPHYFMGAYTFQSEPPFALTAISSVPIVGHEFYEGQEYKTWKPVRVVFPGGLVIAKDKVLVAYGRQDHEMWIATLDKRRLKQSLTPL